MFLLHLLRLLLMFLLHLLLFRSWRIVLRCPLMFLFLLLLQFLVILILLLDQLLLLLLVFLVRVGVHLRRAMLRHIARVAIGCRPVVGVPSTARVRWPVGIVLRPIRLIARTVRIVCCGIIPLRIRPFRVLRPAIRWRIVISSTPRGHYSAAAKRSRPRRRCDRRLAMIR